MGLSSKQVASDKNGWNQALLQAAGTLELPKPASMKKQPSQQQQQQADPLKCPRCDSTNTKFCYYNNYNKSQPRHFCKACKRHWTKGGTLRNVPVGGGRKNKRLKTSSKTTTTTSTMAVTNFNNSMAVQVQPRVVLPLGGLGIVDDHKNFSEPFYENFLKQAHDTFNSKCLNNFEGNNHGINYLGSTLSLSPSNGHQDFQFHHHQYSNLGSFESNPGEISSTITSIQSPSMYNNYTGDHHHHQANGLEENLMNNNNNTSMSSSSMSDQHQQPWTTSTTPTCNVMDMSSNWGWEDFDKFVSVDADLTMPWDDTDIKP